MARHRHFFEWPIPKENHCYGWDDAFLNISSLWDGETYYSTGDPMVWVDLINPTLHTCTLVKDWNLAEMQIKEMARNHFKEMARVERIRKAQEILALENNPVLDRLAFTHAEA